MVSPPWALFNQILRCLGQIAPSERDKLQPGDFRLSPRQIVTPASQIFKLKRVAGRFINYSFQDRTTDVCVHRQPADQGDVALEVLGLGLLPTPSFRKPWWWSPRESAALRRYSAPQVNPVAHLPKPCPRPRPCAAHPGLPRRRGGQQAAGLE